jgi:hypothetical protein
MEFSTSSLTTDAGRSTTSPAAILFIVDSDSSLISPIKLPPCFEKQTAYPNYLVSNITYGKLN